MDQKLAAYSIIDNSHEEMLQLWADLVNVDCGTQIKEGVNKVADRIDGVLSGMGFKVKRISSEKVGDHLIAEYGDCTQPFLVMVGHMDTVFNKIGTAAERPFTIKDGKAYGPGVLDMKGGITVMLSAVKALLAGGYDKHPIKVILAGDEESGHANSNCADIIVEESKGAMAAFNFETGFMDNGIVVGRKGVFAFNVETFGRAAHVGNDPQNGRSAIKEICHKVLDIEALTDWDRQVSLNCGIISGGTAMNATPDYAKVICDMRFADPAILPEMKEKIKAICDKQYGPDITTKLNESITFLAMKQLDSTMELFAKVNEISQAEGFGECKPIYVGGGSDSAYTTFAGVPTVCAMGVKGARNHTVEEWADVESLFERAKLLIAVLLNI